MIQVITSSIHSGYCVTRTTCARFGASATASSTRKPMPRTLLAKLTLVLVGVMLIFGVFSVVLTGWINRSYLAEIQQQLHLEVPEHILAEEILLEDGVIDKDGLKHVFHMMMVIHPSIELYLTDPEGELLASEALVEGVRRELEAAGKSVSFQFKGDVL